MPSKVEWNDGSAQSLTLKLRFQDWTPDHAQTRFSELSLDGSTRNVVVIGSGQNEVRAVVRHEDQDKELDDFIRAGLDDYEITLTPDTASPGTTYTVKLLEAAPLAMESEGRQNLFRTGLRFRRMDGGTFE